MLSGPFKDVKLFGGKVNISPTIYHSAGWSQKKTQPRRHSFWTTPQQRHSLIPSRGGHGGCSTAEDQSVLCHEKWTCRWRWMVVKPSLLSRRTSSVRRHPATWTTDAYYRVEVREGKIQINNKPSSTECRDTQRKRTILSHRNLRSVVRQNINRVRNSGRGSVKCVILSPEKVYKRKNERRGGLGVARSYTFDKYACASSDGVLWLRRCWANTNDGFGVVE